MCTHNKSIVQSVVNCDTTNLLPNFDNPHSRKYFSQFEKPIFEVGCDLGTENKVDEPLDISGR